MRLLTLLLLVFSVSLFSQSSKQCYRAYPWVKMTFVDIENGTFIDFRDWFPSEKIKEGGFNDINLIVSSEELREDSEYLGERISCFNLTFKFNKDGMVDELLLDDINKKISEKYFFEYRDSNLIFAEWHAKLKDMEDSKIFERKRFVYSKEGWIEKVINLEPIKNSDSTLSVFSYQYDRIGRLIAKQNQINENLMVWEIELGKDSLSSVERLVDDPIPASRVERKYDESLNVIEKVSYLNESFFTKYRYVYNEVNLLKEIVIDRETRPDLVTKFEYDRNLVIDKMTMDFLDQIIFIERI